MGVYVEIDDILNLFGSADWEINAQYTIEDAIYDGSISTFVLSDELIKNRKENCDEISTRNLSEV